MTAPWRLTFRTKCLSLTNVCLLSVSLILLLILSAGDVETNPGPNIFKCRMCDESYCKLKHYVLHQQVHSSTKYFRFPCAIERCKDTFQTQNAYEIHLSRCHSGQKAQCSASVELEGYECPVESCKQNLNFRKVYMEHASKHLAAGVSIHCAWCKKPFTNKLKFQKHASAIHQSWPFPPVQHNVNISEQVHINVHEEFEEYGININLEDDEEQEEDDVDLYPPHLIKDEIAKFYMLLEGQILLPFSTVQRINKEIALLSRLSHHSIRRALKKELQDLNISSSSIEAVITKTLKQDVVFNVHHKGEDVDDMSSQHLRFKYIASHFPTVYPIKEKLGVTDLGKLIVAHHAPISSILKKLEKDTKVKQLIKESFLIKPSAALSPEKIYSDYTDGEAFLKHIEECPNQGRCIHIIAFQDAFEFHPFGAAKGLYKINATYFTIGNLPAEYRSKVDLIMCTYLIREVDVKTLKNKTAFKPLVTELKMLREKGIMFDGEKLPVCLLFMTGDNLGANMIGGFASSFSACEYVCRYCEMSQSEFRACPTQSKPLRTPESYNHCIQQRKEINEAEWARYNIWKERKEQAARKRVTRDLVRRATRVAKRSVAPTKKNVPLAVKKRKKKKRMSNPVKQVGPKLTSHVKGVKEDSVLNEVPGFHVCFPTGRLCPCLAHDLFEKIVSVVLAKVLHHCIEVKKWFTFDTLNRRIKSFKYKGTDKADAPPPLKNYESVEGHACETWTLLRLLPLILQGLIKDPDDEKWQVCLLLKQITEYVCAPKITLRQIGFLNRLIRSFVDEIKKHFPDCLCPKLHFLVHYPELIMILGPLIRLWTLRYESKHVFFRKAGLACKCFKLITGTLMKKYQYKFAYDHCSEHLPPDVSYDSKDVHFNSITQFPLVVRQVMEGKIPLSDKIEWATKVTVKGIKYENDLRLVIKKNGFSSFEVGCIHKIILGQKEQVYFIMRNELATNSYLGYYTLSDMSTYTVRSLDELPDYYPLPAYEVSGQAAISLKHSITCM